MRKDQGRAEELGLRPEEMAFYDAVIQNDSAVLELGDDALKKIARELVSAIRRSPTLDWRDRSSVQAEMRRRIRTLLERNDYPPDKQEAAITLVIEQAQLFTEEIIAGEAA